MTNLLTETLLILKENSKEEKDVLWVGTRNEKSTWKQFKEQADFKYDSGFGGEQINTKLLVVGKNWWLERHEYDGSEWWEFKTLPKKPKSNTDIIDLKYKF